MPVAYTLDCDEARDGNLNNESCAAPPRWLNAPDYVPDTVGTNRATYVLVRNMRGDVTAVATLDGRILESYRYTTYGELVSASSCTSVPSSIPCVLGVCIVVPVCTPHSPVPGLQPFSRLGNTALWAGVHRDPHTGWDWMGARVYLPALRQFLSRDPAGFAVSVR